MGSKYTYLFLILGLIVGAITEFSNEIVGIGAIIYLLAVIVGIMLDKDNKSKRVVKK